MKDIGFKHDAFIYFSLGTHIQMLVEGLIISIHVQDMPASLSIMAVLADAFNLLIALRSFMSMLVWRDAQLC